MSPKPMLPLPRLAAAPEPAREGQVHWAGPHIGGGLPLRLTQCYLQHYPLLHHLTRRGVSSGPSTVSGMVEAEGWSSSLVPSILTAVKYGRPLCRSERRRFRRSGSQSPHPVG